MQIFDRLESEVRSYCRSFPVVFETARGSRLYDESGRGYVDFFAGAGALNYGHNNPVLRDRLVEYIAGDGITHGLDMATTAKAEFLNTFESRILRPRGMEYKIQFPGPTGTNAVESALKLARKITNREGVIGFTNAFHGMTLGSLAVTGNGFKRRGAGVPLTFGDALPYDGFLGDEIDTLDVFEAMLADSGSGIAPPAAVIFETIQAEGGLNVARVEWLQRLERVCRRFGTLLIVDDIQVGCGRTGPFFSFEEAGITPDIICLSKSLSGYGLPMAAVLMRPELDLWEPGEHNGTFRGNNHAFVTATAALETYWSDPNLSSAVQDKSEILRTRLETMAEREPWIEPFVKGRGLILGLETKRPEDAQRICQQAFANGLIMETAGPNGEVAKVMPPLVIGEVDLKEGLDLLETAVRQVSSTRSAPARSQARSGTRSTESDSPDKKNEEGSS